MKKEISDRIAQAFFDNTHKKKKKDKKLIWIVSLSFFLCIFLIFAISSLRKQSLYEGIQILPESVIFEKSDGAYVVSFDFSKKTSKMVSLNIDTGDLDLSRYNLLKFQVKFIDDQDGQLENCIRVELVSNRQEASSVYVKKVGGRWKNIKLKLSEFSKIHDWTHLKRIIFTLEEWNLAIKKGELLIDEIEFCKSKKS